MKVDLILLKRMHESINTGSTGCPNYFASKMGVSRRLLLEILKLLKEEFNAPIEYSRSRETYYYTEDCMFYFGVVRNRKALFTNNLISAINEAALDIINKNLIIILLLTSLYLG